MKKIKLETLVKRENKRKELKTVAEVLKHKYDFEVKRMKDLFKNTDVKEIVIVDANNRNRVGLTFKAPFNFKEIAKYLCKFERRLHKNTGLNCAHILNKENMKKIG
jgi:hypothetical protein